MIVPLKDGKLNARHYFGGADKMRHMQDEYAKKVQQYDKELERGLRGSKAHHTTIRAYYGALEAAKGNQINKPVKDGLLDVGFSKRLEKYVSEIEPLATTSIVTSKKLQEQQKNNEEMLKKSRTLQGQAIQIQEENNSLKAEKKQLKTENARISTIINRIFDAYGGSEAVAVKVSEFEYEQKKLKQQQQKVVKKEIDNELSL